MESLFSRKIFNSWYFRVGILGLVLRLLLAPITLHPDLTSFSITSYFFAYKGVFNIYDFLLSLPDNIPLVVNFGRNIFIYPPLVYFTQGIFALLSRPFYPTGYLEWLISNTPGLLNNPALFRHLLIFKFPYLFFDFATAFLLTQLFAEERKRRLAFAFWVFNPVTLWATFGIGHFDIIPTFFTVLALVLVKRGRIDLAALSLGLGASYKLFPLFFLPFLVLAFGKDIWEKAKLAFLGILPAIVTMGPFLGSPGFRSLFLFSPFNQKMLFMGWNVSGAEVVYPFVLGYLLLVFLGAQSRITLWKLFFAFLLLFLSVTHYHPQWFLWVTPFMIIELLENNFKNLAYHLLIFASFVFILFFFEPSLTYGLFAPIYPQVANLPGFSDIISRFYNVFQLKSLARSVFAATSIFLVLKLFRGEKPVLTPAR